MMIFMLTQKKKQNKTKNHGSACVASCSSRMVCPSVLYYVSLSRLRIRKKSLILSTKSIYIRFKSINAQQKTLSKNLKI